MALHFSYCNVCIIVDRLRIFCYWSSDDIRPASGCIGSGVLVQLVLWNALKLDTYLDAGDQALFWFLAIQGRMDGCGVA